MSTCAEVCMFSSYRPQISQETDRIAFMFFFSFTSMSRTVCAGTSCASPVLNKSICDYVLCFLSFVNFVQLGKRLFQSYKLHCHLEHCVKDKIYAQASIK